MKKFNLFIALIFWGEIIYTQITDTQVLTNANSYLVYNWNASSSNIWNNVTCGGKTVNSPDWVTVGSHSAVPYCWGGNSTLTEFNSYLSQGKSAGDDNTSVGYGAEPNCSVGVDCSGFLSRCFGLSTHYSTSMLNTNTLFGHYNSINELRPGDFLNKPGVHTRLVKQINSNGTITVIESGSGSENVGGAGLWRVFQWTYTISQLSQYIPQYYTNITYNSSSGLNCSNSILLSCGVNYHGNSSIANSNVNTYGCNTWTETGPERVHRITPTSDGVLTATISNFTGDLDVYILGSCDPADCLGTVTSSSCTYNNAQSGHTYYIVVDSDDGSGSAYDLTVNCPSNIGNEDITLTNVSVSPTTVNAGDTIEVEADQNYFGTQLDSDLPSFDLDYYLSLDCILSLNDILLGGDTSSLGSDDFTNNESESLIIPINTLSGTYYIIFSADNDDELIEVNENNNTSCIQITVNGSSGGIEDITVTNPVVTPIFLIAGDTIEVVSDQNYFGSQLDTDLPSFNLDYYLSLDCILSSNDILLGGDISSLGSDDPVNTEIETLIIPEDTPNGVFFIIFSADNDNELTESNENNNTVCVEIYISNSLIVIENNEGDKIKLYPNPVSDILYFENDESILYNQILVYNNLGQIVLKLGEVDKINFGNLPTGIYFVNFVSSENIVTYQIMKK